jgi:hypothetical protein
MTYPRALYHAVEDVRSLEICSMHIFTLLLSRFCFSLTLHPPWALAPDFFFFSFMIILQMIGLLGRVISSSQGFYLNTEQHKYRINTYTYKTSMPCVGFEPTIPTTEWAKTVRSLDLSATVTGLYLYGLPKVYLYICSVDSYPELRIFPLIWEIQALDYFLDLLFRSIQPP